jgi:hypothetical protein
MPTHQGQPTVEKESKGELKYQLNKVERDKMVIRRR